jgi:hypothetical protein
MKGSPASRAANDRSSFVTPLRSKRRRFKALRTPPLPWGEGGGEGVQIIDSAYPLTLVPLPKANACRSP